MTWAVHLCKFALSSSDFCHNRLGALFLVWIAAIGDVSSLLRAATTKDTMVSTFVDLAQKVISLFRVLSRSSCVFNMQLGFASSLS